MNQSRTNLWLVLVCASVLVGQSGCKQIETAVSSTQFSQAAYDKDKELKNQTLELIDRAKNGTPYKTVSKDVDKLENEIDSAIEFEQGRSKNTPTIEQWKIIKEQLFGGKTEGAQTEQGKQAVFEIWKRKGKLSPAFVEPTKEQISALFDQLIKTENDKRPQS